MKLTQLKEMVKIRQNRIGFLHISDIQTLNELFNGFFDVDKKSFNDICNKAFELYADKAINNKTCTQIIELCCEENSSFRTESHRYEYGSIYEWDSERKIYVFLQNGTHQEFTRMNHFID